MKAVLKHELHSYFTTVSGYVFGTFILLFAGIYTMAANIKGGISDFQYVPSSMKFIFIAIIPVLTMRMFAEERRQKTDQLLYSLPLSMSRVVIGKYLASLVMLIIPLAIIGLYPVVYSFYGKEVFSMAYGSLFGFFMLGASLIAIGMFISTLTESQAVAAGICFVVMLLNYFLTSLSNYLPKRADSSYIAFSVLVVLIGVLLWYMTRTPVLALGAAVVLEIVLTFFYKTKPYKFVNLFPQFVAKLSVFEGFTNYIEGIFDLTNVVYSLSVVALFLLFSVQALEKRRWS